MDNLNSGGFGLDNQSGTDTSSLADDEMAAFEAECARRLEAEHKRRAEEKAARNKQSQANAAEPQSEVSQISEPVTEETVAQKIVEANETDQSDGWQNDMELEEPPPNPTNEPDRADGEDSQQLSAIMQEESDRQKKHAAFAEAQDEAYSYNDEGGGLPNALRIIFTLILLAFGAVGVYVMAVVKYQSYFINPLCFAETSVCLLGAIGLNASLISNRLGKSLLMKLAALMLFLFYCLYAMYTLSLIQPLRDGVGDIDWLTMARDGISFDVGGDIVKMGGIGMAGCAVFVMPFAFFVLLLVKPMRNIGLYFPGMAILLFVAGGLRVITDTGYISLAQSVVCLAGAAVPYFIFMLPPLQSVMRRSGLIGWIKVRDEY